MNIDYSVKVDLPNKNVPGKITIDCYPFLEELWGELDSLGIIERLKAIPQLGEIKPSRKSDITRYDYIMMQLYLHQFVRHNLVNCLQYTYGNELNATVLQVKKNIILNIDGKKRKPSIADAMQVLCLVYNIGHFYNTFAASRAIIDILEDDGILLAQIKKLLPADTEIQKKAEEIIQTGSYHRFHLINSLIILEKCNQEKASVQFAKQLIKLYLCEAEAVDKMKYVFRVFRDIRTLSFFVYDLPVSNTPLFIDVWNKRSLRTLLTELLHKYNDQRTVKQLWKSVEKMLNDTLYNEKSQAIISYQICRGIEKELRKIDWEQKDYFDAFCDSESMLNKIYRFNKDFDSSNVLKITFKPKDNVEVMNLIEDLTKMHFVKVGWYARHEKGVITILVAVRKSCKDTQKKIWTSWRIMTRVISAMTKHNQISYDDPRYISVVKFFLYYLLGEKTLQVVPTIDAETCIVAKMGQKSRVEILNQYIDNCTEPGLQDAKHEVEFLRDLLQNEERADLALTLFGSLVVLDDTGKTFHEYDGFIIFPNRINNQVYISEAKNTKESGHAAACLREKLDSTNIKYDENDINTIGHDCFLKVNIANPEVK